MKSTQTANRSHKVHFNIANVATDAILICVLQHVLFVNGGEIFELFCKVGRTKLQTDQPRKLRPVAVD